MKALDTAWCGMLVLASQIALAQMHQPAQPMPDPQAQSDLSVPHGDTSGNSASDTSSGASADTSTDTSAGASEGSSGTSGAQSEAGMEFSRTSSSLPLPKPQVQGDVTYLCGGIGEEEARYMKSEARGYDMMLTFASQSGSYLANVNVDLRDAKGRPVLQAKCDAPIMLIDVPKSGTYRIRADAAGYTLNRTAKVTAKEKKSARLAAVVLTWPQQVAEAPAAPGATSSGGGATSATNAGESNSGSGNSTSGTRSRQCECGESNR